MPLLFLAFTQSGVAQESFVAEEFEAHSIGGRTYLFEAPERFRSVGFWWSFRNRDGVSPVVRRNWRANVLWSV